MLIIYSRYKDILLDLKSQKSSLQRQIDLGIINLIDAANEIAMINKKEFAVKKKLVNGVHVTEKGALRSITSHGATPSYPNGYVYTKLKGGKLIKSKDIEGLYTKLYDIYYGNFKSDFSLVDVFVLALAEKEKTENPKDNTIRKYKFDFKRFFSDEMQTIDIRDIDEYQLKTYTQCLVRLDSMKRQSFLAYKCILNLIFGYAYGHGIIKTNPVLTIKNSIFLKSCDCSKPKAEDKILSPSEIKLLIDEARLRNDKKYYVYYYAMLFAIHTGVRVGELCSLKWSDIDFDNCEIHIHSQQLYKKVDGHTEYYYVPYTKNERGVSNNGRIFPLTNDINMLLVELKTKQASLNINSEYIFSHENNEWITTKEYDCFLYKLCKKHQLNATNNHAFRMSLNSNVLIENGISVADRARLLGHSVATNLNNYSYAQKDYIQKTRDILDNLSEKVPREPCEVKKEPCKTIPFRKKESPQTANL